ncbi:unnamed protein product [Miscanthus lutarioriparius]|uniref:Uncharacterized protein n=1 Tax=Miscanthus lutarioriparius TaxID=422564 RepID=A0A811S7Z4_9POAL|nr:unnamed protein product [Miscanthus lutarioriparius]
MASLGQIVLVAGLAFLVLADQDHGRGGQAGGGGPAIGAAAAAAPPPAREAAIISQHPQQPLSAAVAVSKRVLIPIPPSGPSNKWNSEVNHEKPSAAESVSGRRRTRAIVGRRLGSP